MNVRGHLLQLVVLLFSPPARSRRAFFQGDASFLNSAALQFLWTTFSLQARMYQ